MAKKKPASKKTSSSSKTIEPEIIEPTDSLEASPTKEESHFLTLPPEDIVVDESSLAIADPVARYMAEIRKYPLLTKEEEHSLAVRYRETGDREAAQKLVTSNLRFVVKVAAEYTKFGARLIDLVQEGNMGLMQAVKEYNPYKGVRLITYAVWWIRGQIQDYLMRHYSMVRIGTTATQRKLFYELQRQRDQLERMGFEAGIAQLSGRLGIPTDEIKEMSERVLRRDLSLNTPVGEGEKSELIDLQADSSEILQDEALGKAEELHSLKENIEKIKGTLNARELFVLENRLLADEPLTLQEIGDKYKMTREAARQLEAKVMDKIKKQMLEK